MNYFPTIHTYIEPGALGVPKSLGTRAVAHLLVALIKYTVSLKHIKRNM